MSVEVKICGLCRPGDGRGADDAGADYLGVILAPSPRQQNPAAAAAIWEGLGGRRVGVCVDQPLDAVAEFAHELRLDVIQLHGAETPRFCAAVRETGSWEVWKAVRLAAGDDPAAALEGYLDAVDGVLLEGKSDRGAGGVGARFDWSAAADVKKDLPPEVKLVLAGGLTPGNVVEAIELVGPDVVDASSGVEACLGEKDRDRVRAFIETVRRL